MGETPALGLEIDAFQVVALAAGIAAVVGTAVVRAVVAYAESSAAVVAGGLFAVVAGAAVVPVVVA